MGDRHARAEPPDLIVSAARDGYTETVVAHTDVAVAVAAAVG